MKKMLVLLTLVSLLVPISAKAQSTLALQEKCAEGAKKYFLGHINSYGGSWGIFRNFGGSEGLGRNHFTSHYNKKLDKCFIRIDFSFIPKDKSETFVKTSEIYNVFEGTLIGSFSQKPSLMCEVGNKTCKSESEFDALSEPYMKEQKELR